MHGVEHWPERWRQQKLDEIDVLGAGGRNRTDTTRQGNEILSSPARSKMLAMSQNL
jgi:hypothetical protein